MRSIKNKLGAPAFIFLSIVPAIFWTMSAPLGFRFLGWQMVLTSLGQILGLVGMAMFSLNLVLAARLKFLEEYFGGLDRIYVKHHLFGGTALVLLLFHPLFLVAKLIPLSLREAALFFIPGRDLPRTYGILALLLLIALLTITFYGNWRYQRWKFSHKFLGLAFFSASLHVFFIPSDASRYLPLRAYMLALITFGLAAVIYRTLLGWVLVKKYPYQVRAVRQLNPEVVEIELAPGNGPMTHRSGQFMFVSFLQPGFSREYHPFTISSAPGEPALRLTIKNSGDWTAGLNRLKSGARARLEGPFGRFSFLEAESREQIWVAGGIGITPFLSMARSLSGRSDYRIVLFYSASTLGEAVFLDELSAIAESNPSFRLVPFVSSSQGRITAERIDQICNLSGKEIFICGPLNMMKDLKAQFKKFNVPSRLVHSEEFALL